jgi:hypothetical protein
VNGGGLESVASAAGSVSTLDIARGS